MLGFTRGREAESDDGAPRRVLVYYGHYPARMGGSSRTRLLRLLWNSGIASFPESENVDFRVPAFLDGGYLSTDTSNCASYIR